MGDCWVRRAMTSCLASCSERIQVSNLGESLLLLLDLEFESKFVLQSTVCMQFNSNLHLDFNLTFKHWLSQIWLPTLWRSNFSFDSNFMACKFNLNFKFAKQIVNNMACRLLMALCDLPVCCAFELSVLCAIKPAWHEWHPIPVDFWVDLHHWGGHNCCRRERKAAWHAGDAGVVDLLPRSQAALPCGVCQEQLEMLETLDMLKWLISFQDRKQRCLEEYARSDWNEASLEWLRFPGFPSQG